jgi:predicted amidohydrolase YtcJ
MNFPNRLEFLIMRLYTNGTFYPIDPRLPKTVDTLLVDDSGHIAFVGRRADVNVPINTPTVDLGGATVLPGFNDAHIHIWKLGLLLTLQIDVRRAGAVTIPLMVDALKDHAARRPDGWILGRGYDEATLAEGRHPTRADLDAVSLERPLAVTRICGHMMVLNSKALELAAINANTPDPAGGVIVRDEHGNPTGLIQENAMALVNRVIPTVTPADLADAILACQRHQLTLGITNATDPLVMPNHLAVYRQLEAEKRLLVRTNLLAVRRPDGGNETIPLPEKYVSPTLRVDSVKFFADGGLSGATAAVSFPYQITGDHGVLRYDTKELHQLMQEAHDAGYRIGTHAIGDVALEQVIGCYEAIEQAHPMGTRHRIEHFGLPTPEHIQRAARLRVIAVPQTVFLPALGRNFRRYLPEAILAGCYPVRRLRVANITIALSSDAPVVPDDNPLLGAKAAVDRHDHDGHPIAPDEAITLQQAIYAYTMGGAIASGDHDTRGSLTPGKHADFVVLARDPFAVDLSELPQIPVMRTVMNGETVFEG